MASEPSGSVNQPLALVCVDDEVRQGAVTEALGELGYRVETGVTHVEVIDRLRKVSYEVIVLDETFQSATPHDNALLAAIQLMPMTTRRYIFVTLLGPDIKTLDHMLAFAKSVNLVVGYADIREIKELLTRGIAENDQFYRVFRQVLQEAGKR